MNITSLLDACECVLKELGEPLSSYWIASQAKEGKLWWASEADVRDALTKDIEQFGEDSQFVRIGEDEFGLREWGGKGTGSSPDQRARKPATDSAPVRRANLFSEIPSELPEELFEKLLEADNVRIERIVSHGHASPEGFWYDQDEHEWVVVLKGRAKLRFEGDDEQVEMEPGDFVNIPSHWRHRVEWTTPDEPTVWLAVFYGEV